MRRFFTTIFATTGISLILLSVIALLFRAQCIYLETVFQILGVNFVVHLGLAVLRKLELKHVLLEGFFHIGLISIMLIVFGFMFNWFASTPVWILVVMGFAVYIISVRLHLFYMKREAEEINALIKKRNG